MHKIFGTGSQQPPALWNAPTLQISFIAFVDIDDILPQRPTLVKAVFYIFFSTVM